VLDAGMGGGRLLAELGRRGWEVNGIDGSQGMVALARERLPGARDRLVQARLEELPCPTEAFDAVVSTGAVEYADDLERALAEIARVLVPGGVAVISVPSRFAPFALWRREVVYPVLSLAKRLGLVRHAPFLRARPPRRGQLESLMGQVGLPVERVGFANRFLLVSPLERMFPALAVRSAERLARSDSGLARRFATQLVYVGRRRA
jgi:SAM-dependent methyltransferase